MGHFELSELVLSRYSAGFSGRRGIDLSFEAISSGRVILLRISFKVRNKAYFCFSSSLRGRLLHSVYVKVDSVAFIPNLLS